MSKTSERRARAKIATETRAILVERYPLCFMPKRAVKRPLKLGIDRDLYTSCPDIPAWSIKLALGDYCSGPRYLTACVEGALRVALDGADAGIVSALHAKQAADRLKAFEGRFGPVKLQPPTPDVEWMRPSDVGSPS